MKEFNIDSLLDKTPSEADENSPDWVKKEAEVSPVIEKVSLDDIQNEIDNRDVEKFLEDLEKYVEMSEEDRKAVQHILFGGKK